MSFLLLAQAAEYTVGRGRLEGGWEYVWAAYLITWAASAAYGLSLWLRLRATAKETQ